MADEHRAPALIVDDSPYDRSRSKKVEILSRIYDNTAGRYLRGFRLLALCWSEGASCLPVYFALPSSVKEKNRFQENRKSMDKRCCAFIGPQAAITKASGLLALMVKRILQKGVQARYLLMASMVYHASHCLPPEKAYWCDWHNQKDAKGAL